VVKGISSKYTLDAARRLTAFERPALIAWGMRDRLFPFRDAERLAAVLPDARIEKLEDARTFVQLDAADRLSELIRRELAERPAASAHSD
jgi:pimeloyl-ACP methyl ester carboxylesterase